MAKIFINRFQRNNWITILVILFGLSLYMWIYTNGSKEVQATRIKMDVDVTRHSKPEKSAFVKFTGKTWMTFSDIDSPGVYRACVPRPSDTDLQSVITGGVLEDNNGMAIIHCLNLCISRSFTYAALGKGSQCLCGNIEDRESEQILEHYEDSKFCDMPCSGETKYNCGGDRHLSLYRTKVPDQRCSNIELKSMGSLPLVALASYPRSGNTWTRQLIEKASGVYTGSTMWRSEKSMQISQKGGNIDYKLKRTICVKAHAHGLKNIKEFPAAIVLIRNPYRTIVAEVFRRMMIVDNRSSETILKYLQSKEWNEFVESQIETWKNTALNWINNTPRVLVVHYEDLEDNTFKEIQKMMDFLRVDTTNTRISCAIHEHPSSKSTGLSLGNHFRKTRAYLTDNPFNDKQKVLIDSNIRIVNATLITKGLTALPADYSVTVF